MIKALTAATFVAAILAPISVSAQNERQSSVPRYHLMQLAVSADDVSSEDFQERTETIRSCRDARNLAEELGASVQRNRFISASALPETLRDNLKELPAGRATEISTDGQMLRVIVLCNRA